MTTTETLEARAPHKTHRRQLPQIAPCPGCGSIHAMLMRSLEAVFYFYVECSCGFSGPEKQSQHIAISHWNHAWNRRSDAEAKRLRSVAKGWEDRSVAQEKSIDKLIKERGEAERRGAMAAVKWMTGRGAAFAWQLREAINRGEVLQAKGAKRP